MGLGRLGNGLRLVAHVILDSGCVTLNGHILSLFFGGLWVRHDLVSRSQTTGT